MGYIFFNLFFCVCLFNDKLDVIVSGRYSKLVFV